MVLVIGLHLHSRQHLPVDSGDADDLPPGSKEATPMRWCRPRVRGLLPSSEVFRRPVTGHQILQGPLLRSGPCVSSHPAASVTRKSQKRPLAKYRFCAYAKSCLVDRLWVPITVLPPKSTMRACLAVKRHRIYSRPGLSDSVAKQVEGENRGSPLSGVQGCA
jgi:hypothetical protein